MWFDFVFFLEKEESLATLEFYAQNKILNNKISVYRHHLQGCNQVNTLENNDALIGIFLKDLQHYWTVSGVKDPPDFSREMSGLQPTATSIHYPSKLQRLYLGNEKQH